MKQYLLKSILIFTFFIAVARTAGAQEKASDDAVQKLVASQEFVFIPQSVLPQRGITRQLTSYYFLQVSKDTINSDLPYFGRAYSAPINPSDGGIRFTSTKFDYNTQDRKRGGWDILIKPKDVNDPPQMRLSVFENGRASLQVTSNNRQAISFEGAIRDRSEKK
jgi:hypothetical protein